VSAQRASNTKYVDHSVHHHALGLNLATGELWIAEKTYRMELMMSMNQSSNDSSVDQREETVVTQQPGYTATEQVTHDVAAERRLMLFQITRIVWSILGLIEILLGLRFVLKLIGANADSGFAMFLYGVTRPFVGPFIGLIDTPASGAIILEVTTLIAMAIYALVFWGIVRVIQIASDRPSARTVSRSVREQIPGTGIERTTHTARHDEPR
jgi:uncharacterized membrane protein